MERNRMELLPGVFLTLVRRREDEPACFRAALLRQLSREEAALNALLPEALLYGTQRHPDGALDAALAGFHAKAEPLVRRIGEVQAVGFTAVFDHDPARFAALMQTLAGILLAPDTRFGQLKKEAVARALERRDALSDQEDDSFAAMAEHMCCFEDYAVPVRGERPDAGPNYYQKLSKHYRAVLSQSPVELYYAGAIPMKLAAQTIADGFAVMPRGELDFDLGTDIRMNAVEAEPRVLDQSGAQGTNRVTVGWRLGEVMEEPDPPVLEALAGAYRALTAALETTVLLDVHKGILLARCDTDPDRAEETIAALKDAMTKLASGVSEEVLSAGRSDRVQALRALEQDPTALEAFWLEQDLLGLELAPDEYAAFIEETMPDAVAEAAQGAECDAILLE